MADVQPLRALHYDLAVVGDLADVIAPPYDVIDADQRRALAGRSPHNVVGIDLPEGEDPYASAASLLRAWQDDGALVRDSEPAMWALAQEYAGPDGETRVRHGLFARVRVQEYGAGRIRPHERTHPGPKEDRLRLTRATRANLSPIFSLFSDTGGDVREALGRAAAGEPWAQATDDEGTLNRLWRLGGPSEIAALEAALGDAELLIADGHHRYETARVYAEEIGGEGPHRYVLMCLVALEDPGLAVLPTHRLVALAAAIRRDFEVEEIDSGRLVPENGERLTIGYIDAHFRRPFRLTLRDPAIADGVLPGKPEPYRRLNTAVLEALLLKGALGMEDEDISHLRGLGYARDSAEALALVESGEYDAAFFMGGTPIEQVRAVAAGGESMPPKSTFFYPKIPTGLLISPLDSE